MTNQLILEAKMKRFICSVLCISTLFLAVGVVIDRAGAAFRSDERAIAIVTRARTVIGGDNVRSITIAAKTAKTVEFPDGAKILDADVDIALELPNRLNKTMKIGTPGGTESATEIKEVRSIVVGTPESLPADGARKIVVMKDGTVEGTREGDKVMVFRTDDKESAQPGTRRVVVENKTENVRTSANHGDELLRLTLTLLGRVPEGSDVALSYLGESSVDGNACDLVGAGEGDSAIKVCFDKGTGLPRSATFMSPKPFVVKLDKNTTEPKEGVRVFTTKLDTPELRQYEIKFSDYRTVDGVQLPFSWVQTTGGKADETTTVTSYAINPADIAEKFKNTNVMILKKTNK